MVVIPTLVDRPSIVETQRAKFLETIVGLVLSIITILLLPSPQTSEKTSLVEGRGSLPSTSPQTSSNSLFK